MECASLDLIPQSGSLLTLEPSLQGKMSFGPHCAFCFSFQILILLFMLGGVLVLKQSKFCFVLRIART